MPKEYEYRFYDLNDSFIDKITKLGAKMVHDFTLFNFTVYNGDKYIRLRKEKDKTYLTLKDHKGIFAEETQVEVNDYDKTLEIMKLLGFTIKYQFQKLRKKYVYEDIEIVFDMYPGTPEYVEIEAKNEKDLNNFCELVELDPRKHCWIPLNKILFNKFGVKKKINDLTFDNIESKLKPEVKKNMEFFEDLIILQKKYLI